MKKKATRHGPPALDVAARTWVGRKERALPEYRTAVEYLHRLAESSGGQYYRGDSLVDVTQAFADVAETLRRQYSIGYYPRPAGQAGQVRQIKVKVTQPEAVVKARQTYIYAQKKADATHLQ